VISRSIVRVILVRMEVRVIFITRTI